jgi:signal peptidase II
MDDDTARLRLVYLTTTVVAFVWVLIDQATKIAAVRTFEADPTPLDYGPIIFRLIYNPGGAFSMPIELPWLFVAVTVIVCVLVAKALPDTRSLSLASAYGLVVGGAIGNGADRIFRDGEVVDMIDLDFAPFERFPVFNVADIGITVGALLVAVLMTVADRRERAAQAVLEDDDEGASSVRGTSVGEAADD